MQDDRPHADALSGGAIPPHRQDRRLPSLPDAHPLQPDCQVSLSRGLTHARIRPAKAGIDERVSEGQDCC